MYDCVFVYFHSVSGLPSRDLNVEAALGVFVPTEGGIIRPLFPIQPINAHITNSQKNPVGWYSTYVYVCVHVCTIIMSMIKLNSRGKKEGKKAG
jgi:hypothetical protein